MSSCVSTLDELSMVAFSIVYVPSALFVAYILNPDVFWSSDGYVCPDEPFLDWSLIFCKSSAYWSMLACSLFSISSWFINACVPPCFSVSVCSGVRFPWTFTIVIVLPSTYTSCFVAVRFSLLTIYCVLASPFQSYGFHF